MIGIWHDKFLSLNCDIPLGRKPSFHLFTYSSGKRPAVNIPLAFQELGFKQG